MVELTEEAKAQIKAEFEKWAEENETVIADNKQVRSDLTFYKWILRGIFAVAFGGTIAGIFTIPAWIDKFVASRAKLIEDLVIANQSLQSGDYRSASDSISSFLIGLGVQSDKTWDLTKLSDPQKRYFFSTLVQILANTIDYDPTALSDFKYKDRWRAMLADQSFQNLFSSDGSGFSNSSAQNWSMALGYLRYAETTADIAQAYSFVNHVNVAAGPSDKIIGTQTGSPMLEGFILALQGKRDEAIGVMSGDQAITQFSAYDLTYRQASTDWLVGPFYAQIFERLWPKFKTSSADDSCAMIKAAFIRALAAQIEDLKDPAATSAFIKTALDHYSQIQRDIANKNFDHANSMLERPLREQAFAKLAQLDVTHMSASVYQVLPNLGTPTVAVRFYPLDAAASSRTRDSCLGYTPQSSHEEFWVFRKTNTPDHEWRMAPFAPPIR